jgi:hypothetical protein
MGRYREIQGDIRRYTEIREDTGRYRGEEVCGSRSSGWAKGGGDAKP